MATPEDMNANAEYIRMADQIEEVPGGPNINNYANVDLIVEIAEKLGVDAVWAGWGHASENPRLPDKLSKTKDDIRFIGPPSKAMHDLGDKIASTLVAQSAKVNCVPWSGSGLIVNYSQQGIPEDIFRRACVYSVQEARDVINQIGLPIMVKASEGGGGKGIRKVLQVEDLETAFRQVQGEVPGSPIFIMKMLNKCRHLEVQVVGDMYGDAISLYGRDCSVQRRHQKILEEGPAIAAPPEIWKEMEEGAIRLAKEVGYYGAGTVEYLFSESSNNYYFLELNPRLQVEHPVTELITDVNLPATQLNIAMGIRLTRIPDIRRLYGVDRKDLFSDIPVDLNLANRRNTIGHCIAARITGENPDEGFKPTSGGIRELTFRSTPNVWGYFSVGGGSALHEFADSQFGHVFSRGATRNEARKELIIGLKELSIRGEISTPVAYLIHLLESETYRKNLITTEWLDSLIACADHEEKPETMLVVVIGALYKSFQATLERYRKYLGYLERGQIPPKDLLVLEDKIDLIYMNTKYSFKALRSGPTSIILSLVGQQESLEADVRILSEGGLLVLFNGKSYVCYGSETVTGLKLIVNGSTCIFTTEYDPSQLRSSTSGKLVRYLIDDGAHVNSGQSYAEMEVMKMYLPLISVEPGIIRHVASEGAVLGVGSLVARLELDDPTKVRRAKIFTDKLPDYKPPYIVGNKPHHQLRDTLSSINKVLEGYYTQKETQLVTSLIQLLNCLEVPLFEYQDSISKISVKLPKELKETLESKLNSIFEAIKQNQSTGFIGYEFNSIIQSYLSKLSPQQQKELLPVVQVLLDLGTQFLKGIETNRNEVIVSILKNYINTEKLYITTRENAIVDMRKIYKGDLKKIYALELSHNRHFKCRENFIMQFLNKLDLKEISNFSYLLHEIADLNGQEVPLRAQRLIILSQLPSFEQRKLLVEKKLLNKEIDVVATTVYSIVDIITSFFYHNSLQLREAATEAYIRRAYWAYGVTRFFLNWIENGVLFAEWYYGGSVNMIHSTPLKYLQSQSLELSSSPVPTHGEHGIRLRRNATDISLEELEGKERRDSFDTIDKSTLDKGVMFLFNSEEEMFQNFETLVKKCVPPCTEKSHKSSGEFNNIMKIAFPKNNEDNLDEQSKIISYSNFLQRHIEILKQRGIRRVTILITRYGTFPDIYTFRERLSYQEDTIYRHIEPPLAFQLELRRLINYELDAIPTDNKQIHLFFGKEKNYDKGVERHTCIFARAVIRGGESFNFAHDPDRVNDFLISEAEMILVRACNAITLALGDKQYQSSWNNHIFMSFVPEVLMNPDRVREVIRQVASKFEIKLGKAKVSEVEIIGNLRDPKSDSPPVSVRFVTNNPTRAKFNTYAYVEVRDQESNRKVLHSLFGEAPDNGKPTSDPYSVPSKLEKKRVFAYQNNTTYVYDFLELFEAALRKIWDHYKEERKDKMDVSIPPKLVISKELVLNNSGGLDEVTRPPGENNVGMVAWKIKLFTPEYPDGRYIILIGNDITFEIGSFGVQEDLLFYRASKLAREQGIPRIYLAANSGARIGLANEVKEHFHVEWIDENDPSKGYKYLYVTDEEYKILARLGSIQAEQVRKNCWKITDIVGTQDGLGVENLRGSGMIAGETSLAYRQTFTITLVTGRTVGIGAYLVRLGQRTIQNKGPVILTGASALNKVLGRDVYLSNVQLGGTQIMFANGVSHLIVNDELNGVISILDWIAYIPKKRGDPIPVLDSVDPVERLVEFIPTKSPYDPRHMIGGMKDTTKGWVNGFFDKGSFIETLAGWGKTVVCGRARLGGIPMAVIAVETRTVEYVIPADPAVLESKESVIQQAGQVWFPDSSYKTAQAIQDFNQEELPLIIFANWRGFSGGLRDLFNEILKFGSYIVDALREYQQPVFVYLPPQGELRGGAWVVLDPTINPIMMEMYADELSRGGVLEPTGIVEIKYKQRDVLKTMHRLDPKLQEIDRIIQMKKPSGEELKQLEEQRTQREQKLMPIYNQIAIEFADLHDTPGRMKAKNVIRGVLNWEKSREFFYYRVKRRMEEEYLKRTIRRLNPTLSNDEIMSFLKDQLSNKTSINNNNNISSPEIKTKSQTINPKEMWEDDKAMIQFYESNKNTLQQAIQSLRAKYLQFQISSLIQENPSSLVESLNQTLLSLPQEQRASLLEQLSSLQKESKKS